MTSIIDPEITNIDDLIEGEFNKCEKPEKIKQPQYCNVPECKDPRAGHVEYKTGMFSKKKNYIHFCGHHLLWMEKLLDTLGCKFKVKWYKKTGQ